MPTGKDAVSLVASPSVFDSSKLPSSGQNCLCQGNEAQDKQCCRDGKQQPAANQVINHVDSDGCKAHGEI